MHLRVSLFIINVICSKLKCIISKMSFFVSYISCQMKKLYSWHDVAKRIEIVYDRALGCPNQNLIDRLSRYAIENLSN